MLENKTTPITFERKIQQLEIQKTMQEKLKENLRLQIFEALLKDDITSVKKVTEQLDAVLAMNYDEKIAALKAQKAKVLQIPQRDPDHQESILKDNHIDNIEDSEITELIRRRKIKGWEMLEDKEYKIREAHFDNSNIGKVEEIDLPSAPEVQETPAAPETASEANKKAPLKDKAELKRIVLEQFKTKEELKFAPYEIFAKEYNEDENNKYTITTSITGLFSSLGLKGKNIKELRSYLYGEADNSEIAEQVDSDKVVEKADDSKNIKEKKTRHIESNERGDKEATLQILSKLEKIGIFNPEKHLGNPFIKFAKSLKANKDLINGTNDEYLINKIDSLVASPITLTTYLGGAIKTGTEKDYQLLLWKRYCLVENSINGHKLHDINVKIMEKERELLAGNPDALKKYDLKRAEERQKALEKAKNIPLVIDKEGFIKAKPKNGESDVISLDDTPTTPIIDDQI